MTLTLQRPKLIRRAIFTGGAWADGPSARPALTHRATGVLIQRWNDLGLAHQDDVGTLNEPLGVAAAITPWNAPATTTARKMAPAPA